LTGLLSNIIRRQPKLIGRLTIGEYDVLWATRAVVNLPPEAANARLCGNGRPINTGDETTQRTYGGMCIHPEKSTIVVSYRVAADGNYPFMTAVTQYTCEPHMMITFDFRSEDFQRARASESCDY
jgi:hypothetical protein